MNHRLFQYTEIKKDDFEGSFIALDQETLQWRKRPDVVVYYCHGGGFSMGSSYFYMEFLASLVLELRTQGFENPALLALDYSLVPTATYPTQLNQTSAGFNYLRENVESSKIVVAGDSAGATLVLTHLLHHRSGKRPGLAVLISPWTHLVSPLNRRTPSDYLDTTTLELYARQYAGRDHNPNAYYLSPGNCKDVERWRSAAPDKGFAFVYGSQEVFAPAIQDLAEQLKKAKGITVQEIVEGEGGIHAWPIVSLFLKQKRPERMKGLALISQIIAEKLLQ
ncbi:MAG: hypothetical protein Q9227_004332 [Pyrenula ochraceoflavens]